MENPPEEQKKKKKRGFLGWLWVLFCLFLFVLAISIGFFYWQDTKVTAWILDLYTQRLAHVLTSPEYYQISDDLEYRKEAEGKEKSKDFSASEHQKKILNEREIEAKTIFSGMVKSYKDCPSHEWYQSLKELNLQLKTIFHDAKVSPKEFKTFLDQVKKISEQYQKPK
jgi:hypothetical protein